MLFAIESHHPLKITEHRQRPAVRGPHHALGDLSNSRRIQRSVHDAESVQLTGGPSGLASDLHRSPQLPGCFFRQPAMGVRRQHFSSVGCRGLDDEAPDVATQFRQHAGAIAIGRD